MDVLKFELGGKNRPNSSNGIIPPIFDKTSKFAVQRITPPRKLQLSFSRQLPAERNCSIPAQAVERSLVDRILLVGEAGER